MSVNISIYMIDSVTEILSRKLGVIGKSQNEKILKEKFVYMFFYVFFLLVHRVVNFF